MLRGCLSENEPTSDSGAPTLKELLRPRQSLGPVTLGRHDQILAGDPIGLVVMEWDDGARHGLQVNDSLRDQGVGLILRSDLVSTLV